MVEVNEEKLSNITCKLTSLTAVLRGYCYCHCDNNKEIAKLLEFSEILDTQANQLFNLT